MIWKPYPSNRVISLHPAGFHIIKPASMNDSSQPLFCPLCESIMKTIYDEESYKKFECCDDCASSWVYPDKKKWADGWRPPEEEVRNKYKNR